MRIPLILSTIVPKINFSKEKFSQKLLLSPKSFKKWLTRKGTQMINSDFIQTLVIGRPNLKMKNSEKIISGDL